MKRACIILILCLLPWPVAFAGPPFRTDDPVPVDYQHAELYLFSSGTHDADGTSGVGPALEFNYGILPDTQFHVIAPLAYDNPSGESSQFGYGDTEVGVKYRLIDQTDTLPMIGTFPLMEIPTGNEDKGLGNGRAQFFLPLWLQKDIGKWTTYGGGGYWINPGPGNRNYWFSGILLQYSFSESFYLGAELFHETASREEGQGETAFNFGGSIPLIRKLQLLFSVGRALTDTSGNRFSYYVALYRLF